ncbi:DUF302 domain-containing protein [Sulfurimonas sp.]|uniref:DUF302 domain-containing protein n=1 Tax=Sulfurimonas sp. TaxID=2022749 RepID=UPI00260C3BCF|nr:DUF302 domain-containing protein [Sulfurimonas sp.]MCW8894671.1 DUF302 domain-containing protein [Sulfurimonas sp.]
MKKIIALVVFTTALFANDIIVKESQCSFDETVENIERIVKKNGSTIFATINHKANADMVKMDMNPSKVIIFGNPKLGTVLMNQEMKIGLDLPLRILVYKDKENRVQMAYRDGSWLEQKHDIDAPKKVQKVNTGMDKITTKAGQCKKD